MKIQQEPKFQPISLLLETREEAQWLWDLVNNRAAGPSENDQQEFYNALSNWFSNQAHL